MFTRSLTTVTKTKINMFLISKVILHTFIDSLRAEEDREINHHGKSVKVLLFILRFCRTSNHCSKGQFKPELFNLFKSGW